MINKQWTIGAYRIRYTHILNYPLLLFLWNRTDKGMANYDSHIHSINLIHDCVRYYSQTMV